MIKKIASIITALGLVAFFAFAGCEQKQGGQAPEKSAPTSSPTTTPSAPSSPGGK